jgi:hypothetical protein
MEGYYTSEGYEGEVKIAGCNQNFANYLNCKTKGTEECGEVP